MTQTTATPTEAGPVPALRMLVGGEWVDAAGGATLDSVNPATEQRLATFPAATPADVDAAVRAARQAAPAWRATPWTARAAALTELAARIAERETELALLDTADSGNPVTGMRGDVRGAVAELRYFSGLGGEAKGTTLPGDPGMLTYTMREPYGVVGRIIPFNHPLKFAAGKCAAPLMAGNAVVLKPAEQTSLSALELGRLAEDVLPPGVLNVVTGTGAETGAALAGHPHVPRIAFTGSVPTGRAVMRAGVEHVKHVTLELGGKNPMIVFPDADPRRAARAAVAGMNLRRSQGQSCQSNSRVLVHDNIRGAFTQALVELVDDLTVGDPTLESTDMGPVAFRAHYDRVLGYIASGLEQGATALTGGGRPPGRDVGFFVAPTVLGDVTADMRVATEEIFGPVVSLLAWSDYDEMVRLANDVEYGLTANIWTNDVSLAHRTAAAIEAGLVWVNGSGRKPVGAPFGGYKHSGLGKEGSLDELLGYTRSKTVIAVLDPT